MKSRYAVAALAAVASIAMSAPAAWSFPWDIDMYRGATVQPLAEAPRVMPDGTMPTTGGEAPMTREQMTAVEHNPLQPTPNDLAAGKSLYTTNCAPCHGDSGHGDGPVVHLLKTPPKDLITGVSKDLPDGYLYGTIRDGGIAMPSYADAMSIHERWQVVMFVRSLQHPGVASK
jgi:mono/diheme cytochrome c family protein